MDYKQHRNYGFITALSIALGYYIFFTFVYYFQSGAINFSLKLLIYSFGIVIAALAGAFAPDLDTDSIPSRWVARFLVLYWIPVLSSEAIIKYTPFQYELQWKPVAILSIIFLIAKSDKHRGITHALIWIPVLMIFSIYTWNHYVGAFAIGLAVHCWYCDNISALTFKNWF